MNLLRHLHRMLARCLSASLQGLEARPVVVVACTGSAGQSHSGITGAGSFRPQLEGLWGAGELGLDGSLRPCRGVIALAEKAQQQQARALVVPAEHALEASLIEGLTISTAPNLRTLVRQLKGEQPWPFRRPAATICCSWVPLAAARPALPINCRDCCRP